MARSTRRAIGPFRQERLRSVQGRKRGLTRSAALALGALMLVTACAGAAPVVLRREAGGQVVAGRFVSPHAYEQFLRGEMARARGEHEAALEAYRLARAGTGDDALLLARLALSYEALGRVSEADASLAAALAAGPGRSDVQHAAGLIAEGRGDLDAALVALAQASAGGDAAAMEDLARVLRAAGHGARAELALRGGAALRLRFERARALGDASGAAELAEAMGRLGPTPPSVLLAGAEISLEAGRPALALGLARRALPARPFDAGRLEARALADLGDRPAAQRRVTSLAAPEGRELEHARLCLALGLPARAVELAEVARIQAHPGADALLARARAAAADLPGAAAAAARVPAAGRAGPALRSALAAALRDQSRPALAGELEGAGGG